jgi:hypothetical protein
LTTVTSTLQPLIEDLIQAMRDGDNAGFQQTSGRAWNEAQQCAADELTAAVERLAPLLGGIYGVFSRTATLVGALVERGASPLSLRDVLPQRAATAMALYEIFPAAWRDATSARRWPTATMCARPRPRSPKRCRVRTGRAVHPGPAENPMPVSVVCGTLDRGGITTTAETAGGSRR